MFVRQGQHRTSLDGTQYPTCRLRCHSSELAYGFHLYFLLADEQELWSSVVLKKSRIKGESNLEFIPIVVILDEC